MILPIELINIILSFLVNRNNVVNLLSLSKKIHNYFSKYHLLLLHANKSFQISRINNYIFLKLGNVTIIVSDIIKEEIYIRHDEHWKHVIYYRWIYYCVSKDKIIPFGYDCEYIQYCGLEEVYHNIRGRHLQNPNQNLRKLNILREFIFSQYMFKFDSTTYEIPPLNKIKKKYSTQIANDIKNILTLI